MKLDPTHHAPAHSTPLGHVQASAIRLLIETLPIGKDGPSKSAHLALQRASGYERANASARVFANLSCIGESVSTAANPTAAPSTPEAWRYWLRWGRCTWTEVLVLWPYAQ
jgi:hypothetical protein